MSQRKDDRKRAASICHNVQTVWNEYDIKKNMILQETSFLNFDQLEHKNLHKDSKILACS